MYKDIFELAKKNRVAIKFEYRDYTDNFRITVEKGCLKKDINLSPMIADNDKLVSLEIKKAINEINGIISDFLNKEKKNDKK